MPGHVGDMAIEQGQNLPSRQWSSEKASEPTFLLMAGFAGTGKTTLAKELYDLFLHHNELQWRLLSKDDLKRDRLAEGEEVESAGWNAFEDLFKAIQRVTIGEGGSVIIDTSNEKPFIYDTITEVLEYMRRDKIPASLTIILCVASEETRRQRLNKRGSVFAPYVEELPTVLSDNELPGRFHHLFLNDALLLDYLQQMANDPEKQEDFSYLVGNKILIVNTNLPLETYVKDVWREINSLLRKDKIVSK